MSASLCRLIDDRHINKISRTWHITGVSSNQYIIATPPMIMNSRCPTHHVLPTPHGLPIYTVLVSPCLYSTHIHIFSRGPPPLLPSRNSEAKQIDITLLQLHSACLLSPFLHGLLIKKHLPLQALDSETSDDLLDELLSNHIGTSPQSGLLKIVYVGCL